MYYMHRKQKYGENAFAVIEFAFAANTDLVDYFARLRSIVISTAVCVSVSVSVCMSVCFCVCLPVREDISGTTRAISTNF